MPEQDPCWYALYTRSRHEKLVARLLDERGIESFLPVCDVLSKWKDRRKWVQKPLFPGYLFARLADGDFAEVGEVRGVVHVVGSGAGPIPVPTQQVEAVRQMVEKPVPISPHPYMKAGEKVLVKAGPLAGLQGFVTRQKNVCRLVISVDLLGRSVSAEIDVQSVEAL